MKIRNVYLHGSAVFIAGILLIVALIFVQVSSINSRLNRQTTAYSDSLRHISRINELIALQLVELRNISVSRTMEVRVKFYELGELVEARLQAFLPLDDYVPADRLEGLRVSYTDFLNSGIAFMDAEGRSDVQNRRHLAEIETLGDEISEQLHAVSDEYLDAVEETSLRYSNLFQAVFVIFSIYLLLVICYGLLLATFARGYILKPLDRLIVSAQNVAAGRYDTCEKGRAADEIARAIEAFNAMVSDLKKSNQQVMRKNRQLQEMSDEIRQLNLNLEDQVNKRSRELMLTQDYLRQIIYSAPVAISIFNDQFVLLDCNIRFLDLVGKQNKTSLTVTGSSLLKELDWEKLLRKALRVGAFRSEPVQHRGRWYVHNFCPIIPETGDNNEIMVFSENVTEVIAANQRVQLKNRELQEFVYTVSHDLKSPLFSLRGFMDLVEERVADTDDAQLRRALQQVMKNITSVENRITDLLELSRATPAEEEVESVDLNELVKMSLLSLKVQHKDIDYEFTSEPLPTLRSSRRLLSTLFDNLFSNAFKYRHPERTLTIECRCREQNGVHRFEVRDNGIGIPPEAQKRVFNVFYRVDDSVGEGSGVGLTIVKKIVESLGGSISLDSEPGEYSLFIFSLRESPLSG